MVLQHRVVNFADTTFLDIDDSDVINLGCDELILLLTEIEYQKFKLKGSGVFYQECGIYWAYSSNN